MIQQLLQLKAYKNGALAVTVVSNNTVSNLATGTNFQVGGYSTLVRIKWDKWMNSRIYRRALSQAEITATWNIELGLITGITPITLQIPDKYSLSQNYPNPFNPVTKINFAIQKNGIVTLKIYDILGREVRTLVNEVKSSRKLHS